VPHHHDDDDHYFPALPTMESQNVCYVFDVKHHVTIYQALSNL